MNDVCWARATCTARGRDPMANAFPNYEFCLDGTSTQAWFRDSDGHDPRSMAGYPAYDCRSAGDCKDAFKAVTCWCDPATYHMRHLPS